MPGARFSTLQLAAGVALLTLPVVACTGDPVRPNGAPDVLGRGGPSTSVMAGPPLSVAFYSSRDGNAEIYLMDPAGTNQTRVTVNASFDIYPDLSPDGKWIVFVSARSGNADIWVMDVDGGNAVNLTNTSAAEGWPRWSPNGKQIAFHSNRDGNFEIYVMNADGSGLTRVTTYAGIDQWPEWSPNGKELALRRDMDVWVLDLRTGELARLTTDPAVDQMAAWSPNGQQLAFMSLREGYCSVFLMNADGSNQVNLTPKDAASTASAWCSRAPSWSANGKRIYFMSMRPATAGDVEIFAVAPDGSDLTRLTFTPGEDGAPTAR